MPPSIVPRYPVVSLLEVILKMNLFKYFPEIITAELIVELGMPPYPSKIAAMLPASFFSPPTYSPLPEEEEEQETMIEIIELNEPLEPFSFRHSTSEPEARAISPTAPIVPSMPVERIMLLHPAPTFVNEPRPAPTFLNELCLAATFELNEQNISALTESTPLEPTESIHTFARAVPAEPPIQPEIAPPAALLAPVVHLPCTQLIFDNHSPFYSANGYVVTQMMLTSAHLRTIATINPHYHLGMNARLSLVTEIGRIPLWLPIDSIIATGDMLMLWTIFQSVANIPLVTSFTYHDCAGFWLRVVISIAYADGHLHLLSKPDSTGGNPQHETLAVQLASGDPYRYHVVFLREERHEDEWHYMRLQPMIVSPTVTLTELDSIMDAGLDSGMFCTGPADPWSTTQNVASATHHATYWLPCAVYESISPSA